MSSHAQRYRQNDKIDHFQHVPEFIRLTMCTLLDCWEQDDCVDPSDMMKALVTVKLEIKFSVAVMYICVQSCNAWKRQSDT